jgi:hypothetical protein
MPCARLPRLPRQEGALGVGEVDTPSSEPVLEQPILSLKEFNDDQLMTMDPASGDHQQKRQQRRHRAHAVILSRHRSYFWTAGLWNNCSDCELKP